MEVTSKPHVVTLTMPARGHVFPFLELGRVLPRRGVKVTFLSRGCLPEKLRRDVEEEEELDMSVGTVLEDPLPKSESIAALFDWIAKLLDAEIVKSAHERVRSLSPPPCCLISVVFIAWTGELAAKLGIPRHFLMTMASSTLSFLFSVSLYTKEGLMPVDPTAEVEFPVLGVEDAAIGDVWECFVRGGPFQNDLMVGCLQGVVESFPTATYLVNSTEELESEAFRAFPEPVPFAGEVLEESSL